VKRSNSRAIPAALAAYMAAASAIRKGLGAIFEADSLTLRMSPMMGSM